MITYPEVRDNSEKSEIIPDVFRLHMDVGIKIYLFGRGLWSISLLVV